MTNQPSATPKRPSAPARKNGRRAPTVYAERVDFYASARHYVDHLVPIWDHLPAAARGQFLAGARSAADRLTALGVDRVFPTPASPGDRARLVVVASYSDERRVGRARVVLLEHGAGQNYGNRHASYAGGRGREAVVLFLCPNEEVADRNRGVYPDARIAVVGCPKLDPWLEAPRPRNGRPIVAVSFHWDCTVVAEARTAYPYYRRALRDVAAAYPGALGHAHPTIFPRIARELRLAGLEAVEDFDEVLARADLYAVDNSSTLYEFAATDRPVVVLNAPWYRRHVDYGLRFWSEADVGLNVDTPDELVATIAAALEDPPAVRDRRRQIADIVYAVRDGSSASRAAEEVLDMLVNSTRAGGRCIICGGAGDHACTGSAGRGDTIKPVDRPEETMSKFEGPMVIAVQYFNGRPGRVRMKRGEAIALGLEIINDPTVASTKARQPASPAGDVKTKVRTPAAGRKPAANK